MDKIQIFLYSKREETANWVSHFLGFLFGIYVLISLLLIVTMNYSPAHLASTLLYSLSLMALYLSSSAYHFSKIPERKVLYKKMDHICIYYLIAGSYTPYLLLGIGGELGHNFFYLVWGIAILGTIFKVFHVHKFEMLSTLSYLGMGWLVVLIWKPLVDSIPESALHLIMIGGAFYTLGVVFYKMKKLPYHHAIWHLFVLAGSVFHYLSVKIIFLI